jgi:serine protease
MGMEFDLPPGVSWNLPVFWAYHGTHLVGSMLAEGFNGIGIRGVIPNNARVKLMIARVFGDEALSSARTSTIEKAVEWCVDNGATVINLSLASESPSYNSQRLYASMFNDENVLIVAASGNQGSSDLAFPAAYDHVLSVGSVDEDLSRSQFSQYGQTLDLVAPGGETYSTVPSSGLFDDEATRFDAGPMAFTPVPNNLISGELFDCGHGDVVCAGAVNQVCLIEHALSLPYVNLAENCELGGGVGLVVYPGENVDLGNAAMDLSYTGTIPVVTVSRASGIELLTRSGRLASISFMVPAYRTVSGTSMSAAHVSALSIRLWGARPACTNTQIRAALEETALDLGAAGRDDFFGNGLVQGLAAYHYLLDQPEPCGIPGGSNGFGQSGLEELGNPDRPVSDMKRPDSVHVAKTQHRICDPIEHPFCKDGTSPPSNRRLRGQKLSRVGRSFRTGGTL